MQYALLDYYEHSMVRNDHGNMLVKGDIALQEFEGIACPVQTGILFQYRRQV